MAIAGSDHYFLKARTVTFKDQDGRLVSIEKCGKTSGMSGTDDHIKVQAKKVTLEATSISVSFGASLGSR
jgi:hypothetical protein